MPTRHTLCLGISYRSSTLELRDQVRLEGERGKMWVKLALEAFESIKEVVILSTCNRVEIYISALYAGDLQLLMQDIAGHWARHVDLDQKDSDKFLQEVYLLAHSESVKHLFRVISSLDSIVLGENQILGQIRMAYQNAVGERWAGLHLNNLFQRALSTGKKTRSETSIGLGAISVSYAAVELCKKILGRLEPQNVVVIGAGEMATLALSHLVQHGVKNPIVFNRNSERAENLATRFGGKGYSLDKLKQHLASASIVISATGARDFVVDKDLFQASQKILTKSKNQPLSRIFVDIAAPRDLNPNLKDLGEVYLFDIDDLQAVTVENKEKRKIAIVEAEKIIADEVTTFEKWYKARDMVPVIREIRSQADAVVDKELSNYMSQIPPEYHQILQKLGRGIAKKMLHSPSMSLRNFAEEGLGPQAEDFARKLFSLGKDSQ